MAMKSTGDPSIDALYTVGKGKVEFVEVPELGFVAIDGDGAPGDDAFSNALQALYSVSYTAHFAVKKATGEAPRVMALEALWWVEGSDAQATMERIALGEAGMEESDRDQWHWRAMIMQLPLIDEAVIAEATSEAKAKKDNPALGAVRYVRWAEGRKGHRSCTSVPTALSRSASSSCTRQSPAMARDPEADITRSTLVIRAHLRRRSSVPSCVNRSSRRCEAASGVRRRTIWGGLVYARWHGNRTSVLG